MLIVTHCVCWCVASVYVRCDPWSSVYVHCPVAGPSFLPFCSGRWPSRIPRQGSLRCHTCGCSGSHCPRSCKLVLCNSLCIIYMHHLYWNSEQAPMGAIQWSEPVTVAACKWRGKRREHPFTRLWSSSVTVERTPHVTGHVHMHCVSSAVWEVEG